MGTGSDIPDDCLRALLSGEPGDVDAGRLAELESALNRDADLADSVAGFIPALDRRLVGALEELEAGAVPTSDEWESVWSRVEAGVPGGGSRSVGRMFTVGRLWKPLAAVAAGLLLMVTWQARLPADDGAWLLQLSRDARIDNLEVADGLTAFVLSTGDEGIDVIWVLDDES